MTPRDPSDTGQGLTRTRIAERWFGVLGPLAAAFGQQQLAYASVIQACHDRKRLLLQWPTLLAVVLVFLAGFVSWREFDRSRKQTRDEEVADTGSAWFFGVTGLLMSGLAAVLIVAQWLPALFFHPCQL